MANCTYVGLSQDTGCASLDKIDAAQAKSLIVDCSSPSPYKVDVNLYILFVQ